MKLVNVYIEHPTLALDQCFSYCYEEETLAIGMRVCVPFGKKSVIGFIDSFQELSEKEVHALPYQIKKIERVIDREPLLNEELLALGKWMARYYVASTISCYQSMLPKVLKPSQTKAKIIMEDLIVFDHYEDGLTKRQMEVLQAFEPIAEMLAKDFRKQYKTVGKALIERGCVRLQQREKQSMMTHCEKNESLVQLTNEQQQALNRLREQKGYAGVVLHGVTGSGKSEVFLRYATEMIEQGKQVLFLVPEISLTPQLQRRVQERFENQVAIYHSQLNDQQKYEQYQLVKRGQVQVVVGTRSAVFLPFQKLGAIILDEEHDLSYKQENTPRYHCRDIALWRGKYHHCLVLLSSATPSLETYARAYKGIYQLIEMKHRIYQELPEVEIVDMEECLRRKEDAFLSNRLREEIALALERNEQVLLLLNRRGYTPILRCMNCGEVLRCPHCDVALAYHKEEQRMKCHICGYVRTVPKQCPTCHGNQWQYGGMGTQRLQEQIQTAFPAAHIVRMDSDATRKKGAHERLLKQFGEDGDILLGTQMIAKGLDYENVTLVGIVNGDASLRSADYRSSELTFDLLEQACGRSGRGKKKGKVILQAFDTQHYAVQCAANHNYQRFFVSEMNFRHLAQYPPYTYLSAIYFIHVNEEVAAEAADAALMMFKGKQLFKLLGPIALGKRKDEYRYRLILKGKNREEQARLLREIFDQYKRSGQRARMEIDVDLFVVE